MSRIWVEHPLASSWFPETSLGPHHQAPSHPWAWLLQAKTQKPDTLAPQVAVGTESGGQARAQAHMPAAPTGSYWGGGGFSASWCLGSKQITRAYYCSPPGRSHPLSSCLLVG